MSFEITIKETRVEHVIKPREWAVVGKVEVARKPDFFREEPDEPKTRITDQYDYTPEVETVQTVTREVLKQTVEDLDLAAVIRAVNKL